jgi:hypothetical protein
VTQSNQLFEVHIHPTASSARALERFTGTTCDRSLRTPHAVADPTLLGANNH